MQVVYKMSNNNANYNADNNAIIILAAIIRWKNEIKSDIKFMPCVHVIL